MTVFFRWMRMIALIILSMIVYNSPGNARPPCDSPPYGAEVLHYQGFMHIFGPDNSTELLHQQLALACEAKFRQTSKARDFWYALSFTDADLDNTDVINLAINKSVCAKGFTYEEVARCVASRRQYHGP